MVLGKCLLLRHLCMFNFRKGVREVILRRGSQLESASGNHPCRSEKANTTTAHLGRLDRYRKISARRHPRGYENTPRPIGPPRCVWFGVEVKPIGEGGGSRYPLLGFTTYFTREKVPPIHTLAAPEIQNQKVSLKLQKPISQFLRPHLRPTRDRLRVREVVAALWAQPNDVHAVLQAGHIPTAELIPLKIGLLSWASSM